MFAESGGHGKPVVGQTNMAWGPDEAAALKTAHEQFAWARSGWKIQAELPNTFNFEAFSQVVSEDQVAQTIPCGPDLDPIIQAVAGFRDAGYTEIALTQVGQSQAEFCDFFQEELGQELRTL